MVLDACGRFTPPPGFRYIDLPRVIPWFQDLAVAASGGAAVQTQNQVRIENTSDTVFICRGIATNNGLPLRVKWPDGRFFNQLASFGEVFPASLGAAMIALNQERQILAGAKIAVELIGAPSGQLVKVSFWGVLRYMLRDTGQSAMNQLGQNASCLIGYPSRDSQAKYGADTASKLLMMPDPIRALGKLPRLICGPNQNIMAPEFLLGDQIPLTPVGYEDESFTFFSQPFVVPVGGESYGNAIIVPGADDVVIKNIAPFVTYQGSAGGVPTMTIRLPNGYSVTGGDMVPLNLWPAGGAIFPSLRVEHGGRLIVDMADSQASGSPSITTVLQFDGVKRRKKAVAS